MELADIREGKRVWIINRSKVPQGEQAFGTVQRVFHEYGDVKFLNISVLLDGGGHVVGGLQPGDLDFE
ncbi:hypothetical protein [Pseudomonas sp. TMP9]|uniref:hypothetical protein n=1 Tax=Pseudomonas sp. TMP9 TaxID=3133144 RepID=UPI0030D3561D